MVPPTPANMLRRIVVAAKTTAPRPPPPRTWRALLPFLKGEEHEDDAEDEGAGGDASTGLHLAMATSNSEGRKVRAFMVGSERR